MIAQVFVFVIGLAYAFSPDLLGLGYGVELVGAHVLGPLVAALALASCFPSLAFLKHLVTWLGFALVISPFALWWGQPSALIVQAVAGLWIMGFSMLAKPIYNTDGWDRVLTPKFEESDLHWE